ncbi:hypothetical protein JZ751_001583 [Albula glossodonta]|uniref:folate gamma-glutamyl hydrolase n=1 Tax=Albula glossodonta TaxID=121402 RepID=A0A8T2PU32_9TELE|nr:hypothetical protein JZ751_001583 [Albula glossodonta]
MLSLRVFACFCAVFVTDALPLGPSDTPVNDRPIIGVLTQEVVDEDMLRFGKTYIPASYVKYLESGGCRVMPIRLKQTLVEYENIFKTINGMMFIGGAADLQTSDYARAAKAFFRLAVEANDAGDYFPIWGTCMGFQLLTVLVAGQNLLTNTTAENLALPLNFTNGRKYPFYGVQWHPEVNRFQWNPNLNFPHSKNAVRVSSLLAEFFVNEARKNMHQFSGPEEEAAALIYNYTPVYVGNISGYEQSYFF